MKKLCALLLVLMMLLSLFAGCGEKPDTDETTGSTYDPDKVGIKPFMLLSFDDVDESLYTNVDDMYQIILQVKENKLSMKVNEKESISNDLDKIAADMKKDMDRRPEGMRYICFSNEKKAFGMNAEAVAYLDNGVNTLKEQFSLLIDKFAALGGKLDGMVTDLEYVGLRCGDIDKALVENPSVLSEIVEHPLYKTEIRPLLEAYEFPFYPTPSADKPEIYSICKAAGYQYEKASATWETVMRIRLNQYLDKACFEPILKHYPDAKLSDYQSADTYAWLKGLGGNGAKEYLGGNGIKAGNVSNYNTYAFRPTEAFYRSGRNLYQKPVGYNKAVYDEDPFAMFVWEIGIFKDRYQATDTKEISAWVTYYSYGSTRETSTANTPYYTEGIYHIGMLDPQPFLLFIYKQTTDPKLEAYNYRVKVASEIMSELTRVAGAADRKPILVPTSWNDSFVLSGMYAGGRNIWRITPDTTNGTTVESFKIADKDPTFAIDGKTITFPQGKIIEDSEISEVGTCGYWVETPANVEPVITSTADHYRQYPSFMEDFEDYTVGEPFDFTTALPNDCWSFTLGKDGKTIIQDVNGDKALAITGTMAVRNLRLPQNITAGDNYAKQQAWEVTATLPEQLDGKIILLSSGRDSGFKIEDGKLYYDQGGESQLMKDVSLTAGGKYTFKRDFDFRTEEAFTCSYFVYDAEGKCLGSVKDVPMIEDFNIPVTNICMSCADLTGTLLLDDYKLYPTGVTTDFELYKADNGMLVTETEIPREKATAYRLSWINASAEAKSYSVMAAYYEGDKLVSEEVVKQVQMQPGYDGVETGIVEIAEDGQTVLVYLKENKEGIDTAKLLMIVAAAILLIAICVVVLFLTKKKKPQAA